MAAARKFTAEQYARACELKAQGLSLKAISATTGVSTASLRNNTDFRKTQAPPEARRNNIAAAKGTRVYSQELRASVCTEYLRLKSLQAVAAAHGISKRGVKFILSAAAVRLPAADFKALKQEQNRSYRAGLTEGERQRQDKAHQDQISAHWAQLPEEEQRLRRDQLRQSYNLWRKDLTEEERLHHQKALRRHLEPGLWARVGATSWDDYFQKLLRSRGFALLSPYRSTFESLRVRCPSGHIFEARANNLQQDSGCPRCSSGRRASRNQVEIHDYVVSLLPGTEVILGDGVAIKPLELDVFIPGLNFALEHDGIYHHSSKSPSFVRGDSFRKWRACHDKGIKLFVIFEDEWWNRRDLVKAMIRWRCNCFSGTRLHARKLQLVHLAHNDEYSDFFSRNHIDGHRQSDFAHGLKLGKKLVACASFARNPHQELELTRLATDYDYAVAGAASRLLSRVEGPLVSYSNNRLSSGGVYQRLGFQLVRVNRPNYFYTDCRKRISRWACQRRNEAEILAQYPTEELQALAGVFSRKHFGDDRPLYRIEDCGHMKWIRA